MVPAVVVAGMVLLATLFVTVQSSVGTDLALPDDWPLAPLARPDRLSVHVHSRIDTRHGVP